MKAGHAPAGYEYSTQTRDVYRFGFEPAGALEFINEYSGLAVTPAAILASQNSKLPFPACSLTGSSSAEAVISRAKEFSRYPLFRP